MIEITSLAAEKFKKQLSKRNNSLGIRLSVKPTGCSGMSYVLDYVDTAPVMKNQHTHKSNDITIWVDEFSYPYVNGVTIDWKKDGLNEGFEFINPKEAARCGCGESFTL